MKQDFRVRSVFGTRPEMTGMALMVRGPVQDVRVGVTAQHCEMLGQVLSPFAIAPGHDRDIMRPQDLRERDNEMFGSVACEVAAPLYGWGCGEPNRPAVVWQD